MRLAFRSLSLSFTLAFIRLFEDRIRNQIHSLQSLNIRVSRRIVAAYHLDAILLVFLGVYAYRDVYPLCTYSKVVLDGSEGWILWTKVALLCVVAVGIPLFTPRVYVHVDSEKALNPEQTASWASLLSYSFLDRFILLAYRSSQISEGQLPPLAEYDNAQNLKTRGFSQLDPAFGGLKRHIFFGLMRVFSAEYTILGLLSLLSIMAEFASPIGYEQDCSSNYIETDGQNAVVRPFFWIAWLFFGPVIQSFSKQFYEFVSHRTLVQAEALLTELIFEHSLRIRPGHTAHESSESTNPNANTVGRLNNLVTTDLANVMAAKDFFQLFIQVPLQIVLCVAFLYVILGWSAFVGLAIILLSFPVPGLVGKLFHGVQTNLLQATDSRVSQVVETLNMIRLIKLFGWKKVMGEKVQQRREEELKLLWRREYLGTANSIINASKVFSTMTVIEMFRRVPSNLSSSVFLTVCFRTQLYIIFEAITLTITGKVSLDRISDFLHNSDLLDEYSNKAASHQSVALQPDVIGFNNASFSWSRASSGTSTPSGRDFILRVESELVFKRGGFNIICGQTGSGKSSILLALLRYVHFVPREMHFLPSGSDSWFSLPRKAGIAYAAQESWLQNDTIKANILFGSPFDAERYRKVIYQCGLEHDIKHFEAGDATEVGEKGLTLSGGQKARITLARAVYSSAEILLLDDVLAALDVHTAKWIVNKCFTGELIRDRTVLLVTHNVALVSAITDFVVSVGLDGRVVGEASIKKAITKDSFLLSEFQKDEESIQKNAEEVDAAAPEKPIPVSAGKLVVEEEKEEGLVKWGAIKMYLDSLGGNHRLLFHLCFLFTMVFSNVSIIGQTAYLGFWGSQYDNRPASEPCWHFLYVTSFLLPVFANFILSIALIVFSSIFWHLVCYIVFVKGALRASTSIHRQLMESVLGTTLRWLDITPSSRIIARATEDMNVVDGPLRRVLFGLWNGISYMFIQYTAVVAISPVFIFPGLFLIAVAAVLTQLSVKRELANTRAPVLAHFSASVSGLTSIRAYGFQNAFIEESHSRINTYSRAARTFHNLSRWIALRLDLLSACFVSALAVYLVYIQKRNAAVSGFSLSMGVSFGSVTLFIVQILNEFEIQSKVVERIRQYITIEQEPKPTKRRDPPAYWPASGALRVEHLTAKYSSDGPEVLHDISFTVNSGERIGVVGRTGSGKSSLTLSLLRGIQTDGEMVYDGIPTSELEVETLRSKITFIPQVPELLGGTLRYNLDPFGQFEDASLNNALRSAGLHSLQGETDDNRLMLDTAVDSGGNNLSVGQRQILALARAIVRGSKLLILDEDHKTDEVIQTSLRSELGDATLITVAHRLATIMDFDRIMILEDGHIAEFDAPKVLLEKEGGLFRQLVEQSEDREALYKIAFTD
ncbi:P-loop containing nucleoside triphosphate hydrolase protein [Gymnopus androsaceus JB14]|uniref:P-loop containing nucleoside triphosphate hydrolase protein n=1 Tax=Gymnopus androsaceus JB14 TaxID=1447944 RepID=A0A6A4IH46_9AGAR|nr:P-loop containing nucleoside triphosphate hydrolase protein [Gymnopus androsaceus JB14]